MILLAIIACLQVPPELPPDSQPAPPPPTTFRDFTTDTNGFLPQDEMDDAREEFEEREQIATGLGPVYNAQGCADCHQNPVTGGNSQVTELRAGSRKHGRFVDPPGGSLINDRAISALIQERVLDDNEIRTFRASPPLFGLGFVECIANQTLEANVNRQPPGNRGQLILVPLLESPGKTRVGRFGWKCQHASLLSFSADAYLNEIGITTPLLPNENTSLGRDVSRFDMVADPEDEEDFLTFARFMRSLKVPPQSSQHSDSIALEGGRIFRRIGCINCHTEILKTAPVGTSINGGAFTVPEALGDKEIRPFSDFALWDIGTGDGIVQEGGQDTANKIRTAPLWGLRVRNRFMHDAASVTVSDAIGRHKNQAAEVRRKFDTLNRDQRRFLLFFLGTI